MLVKHILLYSGWLCRPVSCCLQCEQETERAWNKWHQGWQGMTECTHNCFISHALYSGKFFFFFFLSWVKKPWDSVISERAQEMTCFFSVRLYTRCKITHLKWPPWPLHTLYLYSCEPYQHSFSNFWPSPLFWFVGFVRVWLPFCESYSCSTSDLGFSLVPRPSPSFLLLVVR